MAAVYPAGPLPTIKHFVCFISASHAACRALCAARRHVLVLKKFYDLFLDVLYLLCRLEACHHLAFLVDEEFREIPLYVRLLLVLRVCLAEHLVENRRYGVRHVPACEALLFLEELVQRLGVIPVHLYFLEARELCAVCHLAEAVDVLNEVESSHVMQKLWESYRRKFSYAADLEWNIIMRAVRSLYALSEKESSL